MIKWQDKKKFKVSKRKGKIPKGIKERRKDRLMTLDKARQVYQRRLRNLRYKGIRMLKGTKVKWSDLLSSVKTEVMSTKTKDDKIRINPKT